MEFTDKTFKDEEVRLDSNSFTNCRFENCAMVYGGGPIPTIRGCHFQDSRWSFVDNADQTVAFMRAVYHGMGDNGREMIEATFEQIRKPY